MSIIFICGMLLSPFLLRFFTFMFRGLTLCLSFSISKCFISFLAQLFCLLDFFILFWELRLQFMIDIGVILIPSFLLSINNRFVVFFLSLEVGNLKFLKLLFLSFIIVFFFFFLLYIVLILRFQSAHNLLKTLLPILLSDRLSTLLLCLRLSFAYSRRVLRWRLWLLLDFRLLFSLFLSLFL